MKEAIKAAGETANKAIQAARDLGKQIGEKQAKGEPVADLEASFEKAKNDSADAIKTLNRLKDEDALEQQQRELNDPKRKFSHRASDPTDPTDPANRHDREPGRREVSDRARVMVENRGRSSIERMCARLDRQAAQMSPVMLDGAHEAYEAFLRSGGQEAAMERSIAAYAEENDVKPAELHALMTGDETLGGALVPPDHRSEIMRDVAGIAVFASLARVETTGRDVLSFPSIASKSAGEKSYPSGFSGKFKKSPSVTGGTAPTTQNQPKFERNRVPVHNWEPDAIEIERNLLEDADANLEGMLNEVISETLAMDMDDKGTNGTGVNEPLGILTTQADFVLPTVNSGSASALTYEGLVDLYAALPQQYRQRAAWMMNTASTFAAILKLKDSQGRPLFAVNEVPGTLWGRQIAFNEFMPDIAANAFSIVFGDFSKYVIAMRADLRILRLAEKFAPNIGLLPWSRFGGQTVRPNAFRRHKIAA